jgi:hypothetical protein
MKHRRPTRPSLKIGAVALVVAALGLSPMASNAIAASSVGGTVSRAETLERAQFWVNRGVVYSQNRTYPDPGNKRYRTDCSGYVAMAWHMSTGGTWLDGGLNTDGFSAYTGKTVLRSVHDLKPGDAILKRGHIELFVKWKDPNDHGDGAYVYSLNGPADRDWAKGPTRNSHGQVGFNTWADMTTYTAIRYNKIRDSGGSGAAVDGQLYREPDGTIAVIVGGAPARFTSMAELAQSGYGSTGWFKSLPQEPRDGSYMRDSRDGSIFLVVGGAKYPLSYAEWGQLGYPGAHNTPPSYIAQIDGVPLDGSHLRDVATGTIYLIAGGAKYALTAAQYAGLGSPSFTNVPIGFLYTLPALPRSGTFLRDRGTGSIFLVVGGAKYGLSYAEWQLLGFPTFTNAPIEWMAGLGSIPTDGNYLRDPSDGTIYAMTGGKKKPLSYAEWSALGFPAFTNVPGGFLASIPTV